MSGSDPLQGIASTLSNADAGGDAFHVSRATFQTIIDQLQRLNKNGDNQDQVIHELRSEISSLKPQVQGLQAENVALKREVEALRVQQREVPSSAPSATAPLPRVNMRSRSVSSSLSYVSESASTLNVVPATFPQGSNTTADTAEVNVEKKKGDSRKRQQAASSWKVAEVPSTQSSSESPPRRRAGLRKRKAPAQPDADWQPPQVHPAKRPRRTRETSHVTDVSSPPIKGKPAQLILKGEPSPSPPPVEQKIKLEVAPPLSLITKASTFPLLNFFPAKDIKSDCLMMPLDVADQLLSNVPTLKVDPPPLPLELPITMLGAVYKAATQGLLWHNSKKKGVLPRDVRRFIYPGFDTNPQMTSRPGEPGLLLCGRTELLQGTWSLFTRVTLNNSSLKRWNYAGEYSSEVVGTLSAQDFAMKPDRVKGTWGKKIAHHKKHLPYAEMRARISLRKAGEAVNDDNMAKELKVIKKTPKSKSKLSIQDVINAFESGDETIPIVRMECVSYDRTFAEELLAKSKAFKISKAIKAGKASRANKAYKTGKAYKTSKAYKVNKAPKTIRKTYKSSK